FHRCANPLLIIARRAAANPATLCSLGEYEGNFRVRQNEVREGRAFETGATNAEVVRGIECFPWTRSNLRECSSFSRAQAVPQTCVFWRVARAAAYRIHEALRGLRVDPHTRVAERYHLIQQSLGQTVIITTFVICRPWIVVNAVPGPLDLRVGGVGLNQPSGRVDCRR